MARSARPANRSSTKVSERTRAIRRLDLFLKELGTLTELYANPAMKSLETDGKTATDVLKIIDGDPTERMHLREDEEYAKAELRLANFLSPPKASRLSFGPDEHLFEILPADVCDKLFDSIINFQHRFLVSDMQWNLDGPLAACLQLGRSGLLLTAMAQGVQKLIDIEYDGPIDLDEEQKGWVAADYVQFLCDHGEFLKDFNRFRTRLLEAASRKENDAVNAKRSSAAG